jgi:hypothetical protein
LLLSVKPIGYRDFKLSPTFTEQYKDKQPNWKWGGLSYLTYKRCVDISTPVLCSDLTWRPAGDLKVGESIVAFDIEPVPVYKSKKRYIRHAEILHNTIEDALTLGIELEDGMILYATPDHEWLVKFDAGNTISWRQTKDLLSTKKGNPVYLIRPFGKPWSSRNDYIAGYLASAYDGEGNIDGVNGISFTQTENAMLHQVEVYLREIDFPFTKKVKNGSTTYQYKENRKICYSIRTHSIKNIIRFLGELRPVRLLDRFSSYTKERWSQRGGSELRCSPEDYIKVVRVFDAGIRQVAILSTSTETHFTGGFASHNTYSRPLDTSIANGPSEEYWQTLVRVVEGTYNIQKLHCTQYNLPWSNEKAQRSAQEMYRLMWEFKFLPPGRGLQFMGTPTVEAKGGAVLLNCGFISTKDIKIDFSRPFTWLMDMSMLGVGPGFDVDGAYNSNIIIKHPIISDIVHVVEDTREGWIKVLEIVLDAYIGKGSLPKGFDYSLVRPKGIPLKTMGGLSSGPQPLIEMVADLTKLYDSYIGKKVDSTLIVDTMNYSGKAVVSGGIRRTAQIALGDPNDREFTLLKRDLVALKDRRWASNNAPRVTVGMDYRFHAESTRVNGEPGYYWLENARAYGRMCDGINWDDIAVEGINPCGEQPLENAECCCLVETFPSHHESIQEYLKTLKYAYLYAKTVTLIPIHDQQTNAIQLKNRRIGVSQAGITDAIAKLGIRKYAELCDKGYQYITSLDKVYSDWMCIPRSKKRTSIKPGGTVPLVAGVEGGERFPISLFSIRRVRIQDTSPYIERCRQAGYHVEPSANEPNTWIIEFPVRVQAGTRTEQDVSMWEQLELTALLQSVWSDNSVSVTVKFSPEEGKDIARALELYETRLKAVTFFPKDKADQGYVQPPYEVITEAQYLEMTANLLPLDLSAEGFHDQDDKWCSGESCMLPLMN